MSWPATCGTATTSPWPPCRRCACPARSARRGARARREGQKAPRGHGVGLGALHCPRAHKRPPPALLYLRLPEPRYRWQVFSDGPAYWAFLVYTAACFIGFFAVLWRSCTSVLRSLSVPSATVAVGGFLLSSADIFRLEWARTLNFSLIYGILVIVALELCLDLGIIPSTRSFAKVFAKLPFDLKIVSRDGSLFRKTAGLGRSRPVGGPCPRVPSAARRVHAACLPRRRFLRLAAFRRKRASYARHEEHALAWPSAHGKKGPTSSRTAARSSTIATWLSLLAGLEAESRLVGDVRARSFRFHAGGVRRPARPSPGARREAARARAGPHDRRLLQAEGLACARGGGRPRAGPRPHSPYRQRARERPARRWHRLRRHRQPSRCSPPSR